MSEIVELKDGDSIMKLARANNEYLGVIDIVDAAPLKIGIEKLVYVKDAEFEKGRKTSGLALVFKKSPKKLLLNATNATRLHELFGNNPADVAGKEITLQVVQLPRAFNGKTHGIRIA